MQEKELPSPLALVIEDLRDAGNADERGSDGTPLWLRLSRALRSLLLEEAKAKNNAFAVFGPRGPRGWRGRRFTVKGEVSLPDGGGRGLLIVRLYDDKKLIGQWAGTAQGLRDYTGNLNRNPKVHTLGLIGDISSRITKTVLEGPRPDPDATPVEVIAALTLPTGQEKSR